MNLRSLTVLALCAGVPMLAQTPGLTISKGDSELTVFGILDAGIANVSHTLSFSDSFVTGVNPTALPASTVTNAGSATGVMNGGISQTRWGIKGQLGLGQGLKGVFDLESAFSLGNGTLGSSALAMQTSNAQVSADTSLQNQLFGRAAYVGLASDTFGTLTIGRHTSLMLDAIPAYDALQGAQMFTPIGFSGSYGGGGATDNSRVDNSLKYKLKAGDFSIGGLYKFSGVAGNNTARGVDEIMAEWQHEGFGIMLAYQYCKDTTSIGNPTNAMVPYQAAVTIPAAASATGAAVTIVPQSNGVYSPLGSVTLTALNTHAAMVAAHYKIGNWFIAAGYEQENLSNPSDAAVMQSLTSILGMPIAGTITSAKGTITPSVNVTPYTPTGGTPTTKTLTVTWLGVNYQFTKALNLGASYYHVGYNDWSEGIAHLEKDTAGTIAYTSLLLDYNLSKAFDVYLAYMRTNATGSQAIQSNSTAEAAAVQLPYTTNAVSGFGIRYKF